MDPKVQKIVMAVLGVVCAGIWVPQMMSDTTSSSVDYGSEDPDVEMMGGPDIGDGMGGGESASGAADQAAEWSGDGQAVIESEGDPRENVAALVERLSVFGSEGRQSLDQRAASWESSSTPSPFSGGAAPAGPFGHDTGAVAEASAADPLAAFLGENPFQGTIVLEEDAIAMFGPYSFRVGQDFLGGEAVVAEIERKQVTVSYRGLPVSLELPPLRIRAATSESSDSSGQGGTTEEAAGEAPSTGGDSGGDPETGSSN